MDVRSYVENYRFEFDGGGAYAPTEHEKAMLEDAIEGFSASCRNCGDPVEQFCGTCREMGATLPSS